MSEPLFGFRWSVPDRYPGYLLAEREYSGPKRFKDARDPYEEGEYQGLRRQGLEAVLLPVEPPPPYRIYRPLKEETGLFRTFADLDPTPEACLKFAQRFGWLGVGFPLQGERVRAWLMRAVWLRYLVTLWDLARARDARHLSRFVRWQGNDIVFTGLPPEQPRLLLFPDPPQDVLVFKAGEMGRDQPSEICPGDLVKPAFLFCQEALSEELHGEGRPGLVSVALVWDRSKGHPVPQVIPRHLWGAILLQFANAIGGDRLHQRCPACGRWFELSPQLNRADRQTCSGSCRTALHRRRRRQAGELRAAGKSPRQIAKELGSDLNTVKKWLSNQKG
jgi:hypothetical protein